MMNTKKAEKTNKTSDAKKAAKSEVNKTDSRDGKADVNTPEKQPVKIKKLPLPARVIIGLIIVIIAVIAVAGLLFRIRNLTIVGRKNVSEEKILSMLEYDQCHDNSILLRFKNGDRRVFPDDEFVSEIDIDIAAPWEVNITVHEKKTAAYIKIGKTYYHIGANGFVLSNQSSPEEGITQISDLEVIKAEVGDYLEVSEEDELKDMLQIAQIINESSLTVDKVGIAQQGKYVIEYQGIHVNVGRNIYMAEKISEFESLKDELEGMTGTLHLEEYDSTKDSIIFTKD